MSPSPQAREGRHPNLLGGLSGNFFLGGFRRRQGERHFARLVGEDEFVARRRDLAEFRHGRAGASRDQPADDDVFLQALERIGLAVDRRLGQHPRHLLEGGGGDERARLQRGLGDAEQNGGAGRGFTTLGKHLFVRLVHLKLIDLLAGQEVRIARIDDIDLLQHLPDHHLDVLVVDVDALQPVDLLDLVDEIGGEFLDALDGQDVVRRRIAVDDVIALLDDVAVLKVDVLTLRDQIFDRLLAFLVRNDRNPRLVL